jgi:hypothetical protein
VGIGDGCGWKPSQDYLVGALRRQLAGWGEIRGQDAYDLDPARRLKRKPDITVWRNGVCVAIADAKYRRTMLHLPEGFAECARDVP